MDHGAGLGLDHITRVELKVEGGVGITVFDGVGDTLE